MARLRLLLFAALASELSGVSLDSQSCAGVNHKSLAALMREYGTDKMLHNYGKVYDFILAPLRCQVRAVLEIGIGTLRPDVPSTMAPTAQAWDPSLRPYSPGGSLRMWRDYFPLARVIGVDIDPELDIIGGKRSRHHPCAVLSFSVVNGACRFWQCLASRCDS
eukprot:TRINITY_DN34751_c0_g1_i2.p1 TRINITY_DN34751_c0_g1~~TRINITY_DN34751_c0_g1_i2.p1  ORF type:complete len:163 (-),score=16.10 TRINITY_DN34751_c0_g1_i2:66-554(-)